MDINDLYFSFGISPNTLEVANRHLSELKDVYAQIG